MRLPATESSASYQQRIEQEVLYWQLELEKAEHGLAMPYDADRVARCRASLELASQELDAILRTRNSPFDAKAWDEPQHEPEY